MPLACHGSGLFRLVDFSRPKAHSAWHDKICVLRILNGEMIHVLAHLTKSWQWISWNLDYAGLDRLGLSALPSLSGHFAFRGMSKLNSARNDGITSVTDFCQSFALLLHANICESSLKYPILSLFTLTSPGFGNAM